VLGACGGAAPHTQSERASSERDARATLDRMANTDPTLPSLLASSAGYVVFPNIGKAGFIAGGAYGHGVLFEHGARTGFVELSAASFGAQIGAQSFSEVIVFRDPFDVQSVKRGEYSVGANVSAVVLTAGKGASTAFKERVAVFVMPKGGAMAEVTVSGQRLKFQQGG